MKKIALISSYCDNIEKVNILIENIKILKGLGTDVLVISPLKLPDEVIEKSDFVFFTKENPVLNWPIRAFTFWKNYLVGGKSIMMHRNVADYGWAALYQVKKMSQIALSYDYDIFYHLIYDLEIDETIVNEIKNNLTNLIHPRINPNNPDELWEATLHFMVFERQLMEQIVKKINLEEYLGSNGVAEGQALRWTKELPISISEKPIRDKVFYWKDKDLFDYSKSPIYKMFIGKNEGTEVWVGDPPISRELNSKIKIFFYDLKLDEEIKILINDKEERYTLSSNEIFVSSQDSQEIISSFLIQDSTGLYDYLEIFKEIDRNLIYFENSIL